VEEGVGCCEEDDDDDEDEDGSRRFLRRCGAMVKEGNEGKGRVGRDGGAEEEGGVCGGGL